MLRLKAYLYSLMYQASQDADPALVADALGIAFCAPGRRAAVCGLLLMIARRVTDEFRQRDRRGRIRMLVAWSILFAVLFGIAYGAMSLLKWLL